MKATIQVQILSFLLLLVLSSSSFTIVKKKRDMICSEFTDDYVDKVTGVKRFIAKEKITLRDYKGKNGFDLVWFKTKEEYTLAFKAQRKLCFDNDVAISFHLLEGKVLTCSSSHIENCESLMTVNFEESEEGKRKLDLLLSSEVVGIAFGNREEEYKLKLRPKQSSNFQQTLECLETKK